MKFASYNDRRHRARATIWFIVTGLLFAAALPSAKAQGVGNLVVSPTRILFTGNVRTLEVTLSHRGATPTTYRIAFRHMRMTDSGGLKEVEEAAPGDRFADNLVRYSPRQVLLQPGESQTVRLLLRKPSNLADGEYRSHLLFQAIPDESAGTDVEALELEEGQLSIRLIPIFGVAIPVIVLHGALSGSVSMSDATLQPPEAEDQPPTINFRLARTGNRSIYGDCTVIFTPNGGEAVEVGRVRGIAVYTNLDSRSVRISLFPPDGVELRAGSLKVTYKESPEFGGNLSAEAELRLP